MRYAVTFLAGALLVLGGELGNVAHKSVVLTKYELEQRYESELNGTALESLSRSGSSLSQIGSLGAGVMAVSAAAIVLGSICDISHNHNRARVDSARADQMEARKNG